MNVDVWRYRYVCKGTSWEFTYKDRQACILEGNYRGIHIYVITYVGIYMHIILLRFGHMYIVNIQFQVK